MKKLKAGYILGLICLLMLAAACQDRQETKQVIKVACVGNSITQGVTIDNQHRDSYPGLLQQMLGAGYEVRNYGYSGRTLLNKGDRPYMKEQMYQDALDFCPDIVTIKLGTNDTKPWNWQYKEEYPVDLETMVTAFQTLPSHPKIYLCYPVPAYRIDWGINDTIIRNEVQPYIRSVAEKTGAAIIDLYTPLQNHPELFTDRIHPTKEGALVIAEIIYNVLTEKKLDSSFVPQEYPGVKSDWEGFDCYSFNFRNRHGKIVVPKISARVMQAPDGGHPWIWRPAFFGAYASVDKALLEQGFYLVYYDVTDEYANPSSLKDGDQFYKYLTKHYGLAKRMILEGFSRGGMYAIDWAANYPHKVACLYLDAPVCDVFSWPGQNREEWNNDWKNFLDAWNMTDETVAEFTANPIDMLQPMAEKKIPVILVAGEKDKTVPYSENGAVLVERYKSLDGVIETLLKPGCDHHPHSMEDPAAIVSLLMKYYPIAAE